MPKYYSWDQFVADTADNPNQDKSDPDTKKQSVSDSDLYQKVRELLNRVSPDTPGAQNIAGLYVLQQLGDDGWVISFMMPSHYTLESLPRPTDPRITLRRIPARRIAAVRYSGFWSEKGYLKQKAELSDWIAKQGLKISGDPIWARYDPPFMPWFMRRNEVMVPIEP